MLRLFRSFDDEPATRCLDGFDDFQKVAVAVAHPDDEVFCSGLICGLKDLGVFVRVVCLTRGEGGPDGGHTREELGRVREAEMRQSCAALGVDEIVFLDHIDPLAEGYRVYAPDISVEELAEQLRPHFSDCDLVVTHGSSGEYWHPAHLLVHDAACLVMESNGEDEPGLLTFLARNDDHPIPKLVNKDDEPFLQIDVSEHGEKRLRALESHESQLELFGRFAEGGPADFIRKTSVETYALKNPGELEIPETADEGEGEDDRAGNAGSEGA